jgi:hypothetical protein
MRFQELAKSGNFEERPMAKDHRRLQVKIMRYSAVTKSILASAVYMMCFLDGDSNPHPLNTAVKI